MKFTKKRQFLPTPNPKQTLNPIYTICGFLKTFTIATTFVGMVIRCNLENKQLNICKVCDIVQLGLNHMNTNASARIEYKQLTMFTGVYNFVQLGPNLAPHILSRVAGMFILSWLRSITFKQTN